MSNLLKRGQVLRSRHSGQTCTVEDFLGGGGQGEVYRAKWGTESFALKWYFSHTATSQQRAALEKLVTVHKAPSLNFLWPLDLIDSTAGDGFGYVMRLREPRFHGLLDLMMGRVDPSFQTLVTSGLQLADSFFRLHADGLCYRDISFGNVFFDPQTGEVLVCDNDNVTENRSPHCGILGTPDFMAPEIVRGEALPSRQTDLYSLAVLLFYMFHVSHPLLGCKVLAIRCWDLPARMKLCGSEPLFIFDPQHHSNAAVARNDDPSGEAGANAVQYWPVYPQLLRDTFTKAFTSGLRDPDDRVMEGEWRGVLSRLRDAIFFCEHCSRENFYDQESLNSASTAAVCPFCRKTPRLPYHLRLGKTVIMLTHQAKLFPHHLDDHQPFDFTKPVAEVVQHPKDPNIWGLKNLTTVKWVITTSDGSVKDVEPGRSAPLVLGTKVSFGRVEGEIRH